jgi:hypothetical protein
MAQQARKKRSSKKASIRKARTQPVLPDEDERPEGAVEPPEAVETAAAGEAEAERAEDTGDQVAGEQEPNAGAHLEQPAAPEEEQVYCESPGDGYVTVTIPAFEFGPVMKRRVDLGHISAKAAKGARLVLDGAQKARVRDSQGRHVDSINSAINYVLEQVADATQE